MFDVRDQQPPTQNTVGIEFQYQLVLTDIGIVTSIPLCNMTRGAKSTPTIKHLSTQGCPYYIVLQDLRVPPEYNT